MKLFNGLKSRFFVGSFIGMVALTGLFASFHSFAEEINNDGPVILKIKMRPSTDVGMERSSLGYRLDETSIVNDSSNLKMAAVFTGENNVFEFLIKSKSELKRELNCAVIELKTTTSVSENAYIDTAKIRCEDFRRYLSLLNLNNDGVFFSPEKCLQKDSVTIELITKLYLLPEGEKSCSVDPNSLIPANGQPQTATGTAQVQDDTVIKAVSSKTEEEKKSDAEAQEQKVK